VLGPVVAGVSGVAAELYVGVGVASAATPAELADLVDASLAGAGLDRADVAAVATVEHRAAHPAVLALGRPVVAFPAPALAAVARLSARPVSTASATPVDPDSRSPDAESVGPAADAGARPTVAEPAALLAAGPGAVLVVRKRHSARATVAVARATADRGREGRVAADRGRQGQVAADRGLRT